jgi:asparagine synthase (glutamine-hydrolysing)
MYGTYIIYILATNNVSLRIAKIFKKFKTMCGISGIYAFNMIGAISMIHLQSVNESLQHRGPNAGMLFNDEQVGLGHRRLSVIDLSFAANQPMTDQSERYTIVFNGEIFNYQELRQQLLAKGVTFVTQSDTEVLLQLYIHTEDKKLFLNQLQGFFAFAIYDNVEEVLFVARDRMGIKPLVYYFDEDKFVFASEISALMQFNLPKNLDYAAIFQYFQLNYIPAPYTIFSEVQKLLPAHYAIIRKKNVQIQPYYTINLTNKKYTVSNYEAAKKKLVELLTASVESRLIADVPLGAFLSGGIDSSIITALASGMHSNLKTFSIGYKDEPFFDETNYAAIVAKKYKTDHTVFKLSNDDLFEAVFNLIDFFGEPFADSSAIPFYILSKRTQKQITVALSGDGADEIFGGYNKYLGEYRVRNQGFTEKAVIHLLPFLEKLPQSRNSSFSNKIRQLVRFGNSSKLSAKERYWFLSSFMPETTVSSMFSAEVQTQINNSNYQNRKADILKGIEGKNFDEILLADCNLLLPNDMLQKVDAMSMANALEVREPFMDYRVVDFAFSLPVEYKIDSKMKKKILQDAFRHLLPAELYNRPKHGFDVPLQKGFQKELKSWVLELLADDFIISQNFFHLSYIQNLRKLIFSGSSYDQNHVWAILVFQHWWKKYFTK